MKHLREMNGFRLAYVQTNSQKYFSDVHAGLRNFCAATEGVSLARFRGTTRLNSNMLNYVEADGVIGIFPEEAGRLSLTGQCLPSVNISHSRRRLRVPSVVNDDLVVGGMAARFLMRGDARQVACLSLPEPWQFIERAVGFRRAVRSAGKPVLSLVMKYPTAPAKGDYSGYFESCNNQIRRFLQDLLLPAAIFCTSDDLASILLEIALGMRLKVPKDLQILGCDNEMRMQADAVMPISSIELSGQRIGWMAGESLVRTLSGETVSRVTRVAPQHVVERVTTGSVAYSSAVRKALNILQRESRESLEMRSVAKRAGVSRRTLETAFQKEVGHSPYEYLIIQRLDRARHLLTQSNLRIGEVAEECGFGDLRTLGTYFRRNLGMSPREWKKIHSRESVTPQSGT